MFKVGFIDYYLDEWHANNYPRLMEDAVGDKVKAVYAYGQIPSPKSGKTSEEWCREHGMILCDTIEEIVEKSDGLLILAPDNCEKHEELSELALKSGKPCFIDKTFTTDYESGKRIFDLANKYNTPLYTTSSLRHAIEYEEVDKSDVNSINCIGPNDFDIYSIHMLEPMMMIMRTDAKRVMYIGGDGCYTVQVEFVDGRIGSFTGFMGKCPYVLATAGKNGNKVLMAKAAFFPRFIEVLCDFYLTKEPKVDRRESLAIMAIRSAVLEGMKTPGEWTDVKYKCF